MQHFYFGGNISADRVENLLGRLRHFGTANVVAIDSPGGTFEFFSVYGPALARQGYTALGIRVASAAIVLQLLGRTRYAVPDATFFFHEVRTIIDGRGVITLCDLDEFRSREKEFASDPKKREYLEEWRRVMCQAQGWMLGFIQEQTGLRAGVFAELMAREITLSAREALKYGIVHRVISEDEARAL